MGSIVAIKALTPDAAIRLRSALSANPGRTDSDHHELKAGDWLLGASGTDAWAVTEGTLAAVGTGVLDDLPSSTDPGRELIRAAAGGTSALNRLRGVYSAIVTDGRRLWAWRDHLGFSPLFAAGNPIAAVATTARQALTGAAMVAIPDEDMIHRVFWGQPISDQQSYLRGAERIPKASVLTVDELGHRIDRYWDPQRLLETRQETGHLRDEFVARMEKAAERALGPNPVVSLSGGIDAPAVAAFAAPMYAARTGLPLPALSAVYPSQPAVDESQYIELVATRLNMDLRTFVPSAGPLDDINRLLSIAEGPVPTVSLAESAEYYGMASSQGFRTILTGEMAEFVMAMGSQTLRHLVTRGRLIPAARYLREERARGVRPKRLVREGAASLLPEAWLAARRRRRGQLPQQRVTWLEAERFPPRNRDRQLSSVWETQQLSAFFGPGLSVEADEAIQVARGVRVRRPWLDLDLWEFFLSLPAAVKYPDGGYKSLVRKWLRGIVPDEILDRRDRTFFDDSFFARVDYSVLKQHLGSDAYQMPGVDYKRLRHRLDEGEMPLIELMWAKDLAVIHAFMEEWQ